MGNVETNFATLIHSVSQRAASRMPWAGYWWPYSTDGISDAAAKYEQASGQRGAVSWEQSHHGSSVPGLQDWWGHCNGWAAAAVLAPEPRQAATVGGVSFSIGDQKALLSEIGMEVDASYFGTREDDPNDFSSPTFEDVYPNQFFLIMTNYLGRGFPVIIDRYTGVQVWNQPVAGYRIEPVRPEDSIGPHPSVPNVYRVNATMTVWWLSDNVEPDHVTEAFNFADGPSYESRTLKFELWLDSPPVFDSSGNLTSSGQVILPRQGNYVIGGEWISGGPSLANSHPDYVWVPSAFARPSGFGNPNVDTAFVVSHFGGGG